MPQDRTRSDKHRILIVDDHPIFRHGLMQLLSQEDDLEVCGEAENYHGATEGRCRPEAGYDHC